MLHHRKGEPVLQHSWLCCCGYCPCWPPGVCPQHHHVCPLEFWSCCYGSCVLLESKEGRAAGSLCSSLPGLPEAKFSPCLKFSRFARLRLDALAGVCGNHAGLRPRLTDPSLWSQLAPWQCWPPKMAPASASCAHLATQRVFLAPVL